MENNTQACIEYLQTQFPGTDPTYWVRIEREVVLNNTQRLFKYAMNGMEVLTIFDTSENTISHFEVGPLVFDVITGETDAVYVTFGSKSQFDRDGTVWDQHVSFILSSQYDLFLPFLEEIAENVFLVTSDQTEEELITLFTSKGLEKANIIEQAD